jgi:hypothetical protein
MGVHYSVGYTMYVRPDTCQTKCVRPYCRAHPFGALIPAPWLGHDELLYEGLADPLYRA